MIVNAAKAAAKKVFGKKEQEEEEEEERNMKEMERVAMRGMTFPTERCFPLWRRYVSSFRRHASKSRHRFEATMRISSRYYLLLETSIALSC